MEVMSLLDPRDRVDYIGGLAVDPPPWLIDHRLNIAVDAGATPVIFRLSGTLDASTGKNLEPVLRSLIAEGYRQILIDVDDLEVDIPGGGGTVLAALDRLVAGYGPRAACGAHMRSGSPSSRRRQKEARRPRALAGTVG